MLRDWLLLSIFYLCIYQIYVLDTDEERVKFVSQLLQHRLGIKVLKDQVEINANDYYEKFINGNL